MLLKIAFISLTIMMIIIVAMLSFYAINKTVPDQKSASKKKKIVVIGLIVWQIYTYFIASSGLLLNFDFPPRFFILLILPIFLFTGIFIFLNRNKLWISSIPEHYLIYFQSFRILVESLFVFSVSAGIFNKEVTILGYNYDMIFALTAPIIGYLAFKKILSRKLQILWNYIGIMVLGSVIFLFLSSIFNPLLFGSETMILPIISVHYPYVLIAGFLMPLAVFIHVLSIVQLSKKKLE